MSIRCTTRPALYFRTISTRATLTRLTKVSVASPTSFPLVSKTYLKATRTMATMVPPQHFMATSGASDPVWVHTEPYSRRPQFPKLDRDLQADVCIVGSGIAGLSTAYELVTRGLSVVLLEARDVLSGETGRTSGHLSSGMDAGYGEIAKKHGKTGAKYAAESHSWAQKRVGEISEALGIECEYRQLPGYQLSQYPKGEAGHADEIAELKEEVALMKEIGMHTYFAENYAIKGWDGKVDQRDAAVLPEEATFHPTKYLVGLLKWLSQQSNFSCFTRSRVISVEEKGIEVLGIGSKDVRVSTIDGHTVTCQDALEATCVPLQKLSVVGQMEYYRTYCIAIRVPKNYIEDCLIYDECDPYHYVRFTACDDKDDYLVLGGCDHKVGQEEELGRYEELEQWVRDRFTRATTVDYKWSGQIFEPVDGVAMIGLNQGKSHIYIITGDIGNGLTHGVLGARIVADLITKTDNPWSSLYSPKRLASMASSMPTMLSHDLQINAQYKRLAQSDISDIEDLKPGTGGVLNPKTSKPIAVYKDGDGTVSKFSALCPHMKGVVCWNGAEQSWDCPVHGSRFAKDGVQIMGPAKAGLGPVDGEGESRQEQAKTAPTS